MNTVKQAVYPEYLKDCRLAFLHLLDTLKFEFLHVSCLNFEDTSGSSSASLSFYRYQADPPAPATDLLGAATSPESRITVLTYME